MKVKYIEIVPEQNEPIESIALDMCMLSKKYNTTVIGWYNGTFIWAKPHEIRDDVINHYKLLLGGEDGR